MIETTTCILTIFAAAPPAPFPGANQATGTEPRQTSTGLLAKTTAGKPTVDILCVLRARRLTVLTVFRDRVPRHHHTTNTRPILTVYASCGLTVYVAPAREETR